MNVLIVGRGGRESAIAWKLSQSKDVKKIFCATGNAGTANYGENVNISAEDVNKLAEFAEKNSVDFTIVNPEISLSNGIYECFEKKKLLVFAPSTKGADLENSKEFSKSLMQKYSIPTAHFGCFDDQDLAFEYIEKVGSPLVIKTDGITSGKGCIVARDNVTAKIAVNVMMKDKVFGGAGERVMIEEFLTGTDVTVLSFFDGKNIVPMPPVYYYKYAFDEKKGPLTGGMGAISPVPVIDATMMDRIKKEILNPLAKAMVKEGISYKGILYTGLIITEKGPKVVEFNVRYGDPETQILMPKLKSDIIEIYNAMKNGTLDKLNIEWDERPSVLLTLVSGNYPLKYSVGKTVSGIDKLKFPKDAYMFYAALEKKGNQFITTGGRVINIVTLGEDFKTAREKAYSLVDSVQYEGKRWRKDIGLNEAELV